MIGAQFFLGSFAAKAAISLTITSEIKKKKTTVKQTSVEIQ